jgi:hypothetical protein
MLATLGLILGLGIGTKPLPIDHLRLYRELGRNDRARVSVWLNKTDPYSRGTRARVYVSTEQDAYLTVLRIDTDGRVRVLFPQEPWDDNWVPGGRSFEVEDRDGASAFRVDDPPGEGYVFAIASDDRFDYTPILTERDHWDYRVIADGQVRGDPYVAMTDLAERIVAQGGEYDYDLAQYDVERHYDYPRFVCYDCHAYAPYYAWNPYGHNCVRFRVVIYDDPYYYPYRYYGGRRVVVVRPRRPQPRYVFVDNDGRRDYVTRIQNRPRRDQEGNGGGGGGDDQVRPRRGEDVGGRGSVRTPGLPDRRRPARDDGSTPSQPRRMEPETRRQPESQPERRRETGSGTTGGEKQTPNQEPPRRRDQTPPGMEPMKQPDRGTPRREEPRREEPRREEPQSQPRAEPRREEPKREEPRREEPRREEPQSQPRAEPRREEPRRQESPPQRAEPRREGGGNSGGGSRGSSGPELRRRRG